MPDEVTPIDHTLDRCPDCKGMVLLLPQESPRKLQQAELITPTVQKFEHRSYAYWCAQCNRVHYAPFPADVSAEGLFKAHLSSTVCFLKYIGCMSLSGIRNYLQDALNIRVTKGYLAKVIQKGSEDLRTIAKTFNDHNKCPMILIVSRISSLISAYIPCDFCVFIDPIIDAAKWFRNLLLLERTKEIVAYGKSSLSSAVFEQSGVGGRIALCETVIGRRMYNDMIAASREFRMPRNTFEISLASKAPVINAPDRWIDLRAYNPAREALWQTPGRFTPTICKVVAENVLQALSARCPIPE